MKIAFDVRAIPQSGIGVYTRILKESLPLYYDNIKVCDYTDGYSVDRKNIFNKYVNSLKRLLRDQLTINSWMKNNNVDIYHNPRNTGAPIICGGKVVVTIHDVIPHVLPQYYLNSPIERIYYELMLREAIYRSDAIITDSEFSKREIVKYYNVNPEKITTIYLDCSDNFKPLAEDVVSNVKDKFSIKRPYFLIMGGSEYRKNVRTVLATYGKYFKDNYDIVVVGGAWRNLDLSKDYGHINSIHFLKGISDEELCALYNGAEVFIFASIYEGFGIPLLEAMNCGTPVVAANSSCLPEIAGDAALYFEPLDCEDLKVTLNRLLTDQSLKEKMIKSGFVQAANYDWKKTVAETYEVYKKVLNQ
jgi:glycosyltransferase involved in cell wall biosynthesis